MRHAGELASHAGDEYHSYVLRVRARMVRADPTARSALAIRVEHVNERKAMYFTRLSDALDFIAGSVRRNVLPPDP